MIHLSLSGKDAPFSEVGRLATGYPQRAFCAFHRGRLVIYQGSICLLLVICVGRGNHRVRLEERFTLPLVAVGGG